MLLPYDAVLVFKIKFKAGNGIGNEDAPDRLFKEGSALAVVALVPPSLAVLLHVPDVAGLNLKTMEEGNVPVKGFVIPSTLDDLVDGLLHLGAEGLVPDFLVLLFGGAGTLDPPACSLLFEASRHWHLLAEIFDQNSLKKR